MTKAEELPRDFKPYGELTVCGNRLNNAQMLLEVNGHAPLLVGAGKRPRLWLSVLTTKDGTEWASVVRDSQALHPKIQVTEEADGSLVVFAVGKKVLVVRPSDETRAEVPELDLRPLGFDVHGDAHTLWVGTNQFSSNTFSNVRAVIGIGK